MSDFRDQSSFDLRCEWGQHGLETLAPSCQLVIIIDVLSFSTAVDVAVARGAEVYPHPCKDMFAETRARDLDATLALGRERGEFSLSPASMLSARRSQKIVLPSLNGASLSILASTLNAHIVCACFRNLSAITRYASRFSPIAIIPAGERWPDGSLRPAIEDIACAGALIEQLTGSRSPESLAAIGIWQQMQGNLVQKLVASASGRQLLEMGYRIDVEMAAQLDVSAAVPVFRDGRYTAEPA